MNERINLIWVIVKLKWGFSVGKQKRKKIRFWESVIVLTCLRRKTNKKTGGAA